MMDSLNWQMVNSHTYLSLSQTLLCGIEAKLKRFSTQ